MAYLSPESQPKSIEVHSKPSQGKTELCNYSLDIYLSLKRNSVPGIMPEMKSSKLIQNVLIALCLIYNTFYLRPMLLLRKAKNLNPTVNSL